MIGRVIIILFLHSVQLRIAAGDSSSPPKLSCCLEESVRVENNVRRVQSIVVTRTPSSNVPQVVAQVVRNKGAEVLADLDTLEVTTEEIPGQNRGPRCLHLKWKSPGPKQGGAYKCEINAFDKNEKELNLTPTVVDIKGAADDTNVSGGGSSVPNKALEDTVKSLKDSQEELKKSIQTLQQEMKANNEIIKNQIQNIKQPHFEQGYVECLPSAAPWTSQEINVKVVFNRPYEKPPVIDAGFEYLDVSTAANVRIKLSILEVTNTGFTAQCGTWSDTHVYFMKARWTSHGF